MAQPLPFLLLLGEVPTVDVWQAIKENDLLGLALLVLLALMSVASVGLIVYKFLCLRRAQREAQSFQKVVDEEGSWEALFMASKEYPEAPNAKLLRETYVECRLENWFEGKGDLPLDARLNQAKATIEAVLMRTISQEEGRLNDHLHLLSITSALAPFLGLFGTVWGVLASFQALGKGGGASIAILAPGISTALMTTIFGLIAAIPAVVAFNYFSSVGRDLTVKMEGFAQDLEVAVRKQILKDGSRTR